MRGRVRRALGLALLGIVAMIAALVGACGDKKGALMLAINTDMKVPKDINAVSVTISANGKLRHSFVGRVTPQGEVVMPATLAIAEGEDETTSVRIRVMAFQERRARVLRDVRTTVPKKGRIALLRVPLTFVNDQSAVGPELPANVLPDPSPGTGGATSSSGAASSSSGDVDFVGAYAPPCPDVQNQTIIDGECKDSFVDSDALPDFDAGAVVESTNAGACFDVAKCFAVALVGTEGLDRTTCTLPDPGQSLEPGAPRGLNLAIVTSDTGECLRPNECYVPLDRGAGGWSIAGGRIQLPRVVCRLIDANKVKLARSVGCEPKAPEAALCTPPPAPGDGTCGAGNADAVGATKANKVDILFVVDDSASMAEKQKLLASSVRALLDKAATTGDVHVGVVGTSLGSFGGDVCPNESPFNRGARLLASRADGSLVTSAKDGVLAFGAAAGGTTDINAFAADVSAVIEGVGERGCGLEAQLESAYHFLTAPDPWQSVTVSGATGQATYGETDSAASANVDVELLRQRAAFLRPDSLVVVVMLTDEDDSSVDPLSVGGQGWAFMANRFPGSNTFRADGKTTTAPRATSRCATDPASPDCTSCAFAATCDASTAACQKIKNDPECVKNGGYYGANEEALGVRFHRMKERFGVDPQYPIARYVEALTKQNVSSKKDEHVVTLVNGRPRVAEYCGQATCTNPLFAAKLPTQAGEELCKLPRGPRGKDLVVLAVVGGVPPALATTTPDWPKLVGRDQGAYDYSGIDPHMIPSITPRPGLQGPSDARGDNGSDPVHGREWVTGNGDLQFACTFALPQARTCTAQDPSCDCARPESNPPLCGPTLGEQVRGKAYPSARELRVAEKLGDRGFVGSVCAGSQGYAASMAALDERLGARLGGP